MRLASVLLFTGTVIAAAWACAHPLMGAITWNRQISRIVYEHCVSCHRPGGSSFSLLEYAEAREAAPAIKRAVLTRSMPPWGAVKGFGTLRDEQALTEAQIGMIVEWADTGTARGNNPRALPERPAPVALAQPFAKPRNAVDIRGVVTLERPVRVTGVLPETVPADASLRLLRGAAGRRHRAARVAS